MLRLVEDSFSGNIKGSLDRVMYEKRRIRFPRRSGGNVKSCLMSALLLCLSVSALAGGSEYKANRQIEKAINVLNEIMNAPDKSIPRDLLNKAVCVGIVPSELRFAIGFGGTYGRGMLVCRRNGNGSWGGPSLFFLGGGNFGKLAGLSGGPCRPAVAALRSQGPRAVYTRRRPDTPRSGLVRSGRTTADKQCGSDRYGIRAYRPSRCRSLQPRCRRRCNPAYSRHRNGPSLR